MGTPVSVHVVATNRKARHNFEILDTIEAGLVLTGTEVKSLRNGGCSLTDGYAVIRNGQATLRNVHIAAYKQGSIHNVDPVRDRSLLLHRNEILKLAGKINERGLTVVPLRVYFKGGRAKLELGVAKGRKTYDKRRKLREDDEKRRTDEATKRYSRGFSA